MESMGQLSKKASPYQTLKGNAGISVPPSEVMHHIVVTQLIKCRPAFHDLRKMFYELKGFKHLVSNALEYQKD